LLGVLASLPDALVLQRGPGARLLDDALVDGGIEQRARLGDALAVDDVELGVAEWWRQLVLHHLGARADADRLRALLDGLDATHVDAHRRVELQRAPARGGLRVAEHDQIGRASCRDTGEVRR